MTARPAAAIFDLDGTLIDTETLFNEAGVEACAALGLIVPLSFFETLAGIHDEERVRLIEAQVGRPLDAKAFFAEWDRRGSERMAKGVPVKPGAVALLTHLKAEGLPLALATSSRRGPGHEKLALAGLAGFFDAVITFDDVAAAKPAPDPYLTAAAALGQPPGACVAFEDSEPGATSAFAAGCIVVQIPDIHPALGTHAHYIAPSLIEGARMAGLIGPDAP